MRHWGTPVADEELPRTQATVHRSRWPGWIWLVPITAAAILAWLGSRYILQHETTATVWFDDVTGVSAENTAVTYRGFQIGKVSKLALSTDGRHVRAQLSLDHSAEQYLRSGTRF